MLDQLKWVPWPASPKYWLFYEEWLPDGMWMTLFRRPNPLTVAVEEPEANNIYLSRQPFDTTHAAREKVWQSSTWDPIMFVCIILDIRAKHGATE